MLFPNIQGFIRYYSVIDLQLLNSVVFSEPTLYNFKFLKFVKICFMAENMLYTDACAFAKNGYSAVDQQIAR